MQRFRSVDSFRLEVARVNRFHEREKLAGAICGSAGDLRCGGATPPPLPPPPAQDVIDGPNEHCIETHHQDHEFGAESSHAHIPVNDTHMPPPRVEPAPDQFCLPLSNSSSDLVSVA
jgi:hypothetical protein